MEGANLLRLLEDMFIEFRVPAFSGRGSGELGLSTVMHQHPNEARLDRVRRMHA
jgi:hypothetical protein